MTNTSNDDIRGILAELANRQLNTQQQLDNLVERQEIAGQQIVQLADITSQLTNDIASVTARNALLNDIIPELRESQERQEILTTELKQNFEQHQRNFVENQRTTNAALQSLEAILLRLTNSGGNA
ncbi:MAG: hypothetical protein HC836_37195 [Richelia sp. RM2_1_2]|nr:hypothetical protein [Richelia sp. RM1_1_1]NJO63628.1 hypothetical protein [Richelia sp. RM2_1_2]